MSKWKSTFIPNTTNISGALVWLDDEAIKSMDLDIVGWLIDYQDDATIPAMPIFIEDVESGGPLAEWFLISGGRFYQPGNVEWPTRDEAIADIGERLRKFQAGDY